ncbi:MAG: phosphoenolpyruvate synthase [Fibrobacteres bacterium]|nr:phosphoenolpyruvate synthase [Fibrobacterota bacterium]
MAQMKHAAEIGGKAENLSILSRLPHVTVPPFRVIDASWFREAVAEAAGRGIEGLNPGPRFLSHLDGLLEGLRDGRLAFLSVRSSAVGEDSAEASFAGQFDTVLNVPIHDREAVAAAVLRCWSSAFGERVQAYRRKFNLPAPAMAVVLQTMIPADAAGVCFTLNPVTGDTGEMVVSASWGLGEGIVSGRYEGDHYALSRETGLYTERIASKPERIVAIHAIAADAPVGNSGKGGTREESVPETLREIPCLKPAHLQALKRGALAIEARYGQPLDLEFAFLGDSLYFLQARPVTSASPAVRAAWGRKILWDNSNIVESYNGLTSPLTFSFIAFAYQEVYEQFGRMLGIRRRLHDENQMVMRNYLGLIRGRVYYNLMTWYTSLANMPFFRFTGEAMEAMMGVRQGLPIKNLEVPKAGLKGTYDRFRLATLALWNVWRAPARVREFQARFAEKFALYAATPWDQLSPQRLIALYEEMTLVFLKRWQAPILADTLAMVFYKALSSLCLKWVAPGDPGFQNDLLANQGQVESTEPTRLILECFRDIRGDSVLAGILRDTPADRTLAALKASGAEGARGLLAWLDGYLELYGSRSMNELKLEVPTLEEDPSFIFGTLKNYFSAPELALSALGHSAAGGREAAEAKVDAALKGRPLRKWLFAWVLKNAVRHIRNREAMRLARSRIYGLVRKLALAYGRNLEAAGILSRRDDVFFLSIQELQAFAEGRSLTLDLRALADLRKGEYAAFALEAEPAERFHTIGLPYYRQEYAAEGATANLDGNLLKGQSCCAGVRRGKVRVIRVPEDDLRLSGEILVAPRTDPGWIPLFPSISALLIEKGSMLSHSAIVAREMGIPTIVGIENLTQRLKDGDEVEVDAGAGTVLILSQGGAGGASADAVTGPLRAESAA